MSLFSTYLLFLHFGLLCFGGGNALIPLYIEELVNGQGWITLDDFGNLLSIAQITPGAIGVNTATFVGHRFGGVAGALCATLGLLTPSTVLMLVIARHIDHVERNRFLKGLVRGVAPAAIAMMIVAALVFCEMSLFTEEIPWRQLLASSSSDAPAGIPASFRARPFAFAICAAAAWAVYANKAKITTVILASAIAGMLVWGLAAAPAAA
jgi:Chromate transport protein ChrA